MRKYTICIILIIVMSVINMISMDKVDAANHQLEDLHVEVTIEDDGSAKIRETRNADLSEGTENYIVIENLGRSTIQEFSVTENEETYEYVDKWDIGASREDKAFKNGLITTNNGYELSWGIGEYGKHEYIVEYTITDFIKQLEDAQVLFWRFVNDETNIPPENVTIEIKSEKHFNEDDEKIWAFGYPGDVHFVEGTISAKSDQPLNKSDYVTLLVQFEDGLFATEDHIDQTVEQIQDQAFEGSDYGKEDTSFTKDKSIFEYLSSLIDNAFNFLFIVGMIILLIYVRFSKKSSPLSKKQPKFQRKYDEEYYRDYPYEGNFLHAHYITYSIGTTNFQTLLTAVLLKWIKEERIRVEVTEKRGIFSKNKNVATIYIMNDNMKTDSREGQLFAMIKHVANSDGILTENQLAKWAERNKRKLDNWEKGIMNDSIRVLGKKDYLTSEHKKILFMNKKIFELTNSGKQVEKNVYKYVNYLHDYSLLNEHEAVNVKIWDDIMIWAAYLGLTTVVMEQFKSLYPQYIEESIYQDESVRTTRRLAHRTNKGRSAAKSRSSGRGGRASRRGGSGSFGGGKGGGTR